MKIFIIFLIFFINYVLFNLESIYLLRKFKKYGCVDKKNNKIMTYNILIFLYYFYYD